MLVGGREENDVQNGVGTSRHDRPVGGQAAIGMAEAMCAGGHLKGKRGGERDGGVRTERERGVRQEGDWA